MRKESRRLVAAEQVQTSGELVRTICPAELVEAADRVGPTEPRGDHARRTPRAAWAADTPWALADGALLGVAEYGPGSDGLACSAWADVTAVRIDVFEQWRVAGPYVDFTAVRVLQS